MTPQVHPNPPSAVPHGGLVFVDCNLAAAQSLTPSSPGATAPKRRRETVVNGQRVKTIDIHAHCAVPQALALMGQKLGGPGLRTDLDMASAVDIRLGMMDAQGIDMQALSINPNWYDTGRDIAVKIIAIQNAALAEACAKNPDRFVALASVALQFPDLAVQQLTEGVKTYDLRGVAIGGSVAGLEISDPKFNPFWAKAEELGVLVFIHPQGDGAPSQLGQRFQGNGYLSNVIGNPLETTIALAHLIFEGTLDRYPGLKICGAHGGGYLPSYAGRFDLGCMVRPDLCAGGAHGPIKKTPAEYLKQLYYDTMVFTPEGLRHLAAEVGPDRLMIGTDYPYPWTSTSVEHVLATPGLTGADRIAMLGGTAAGLLGIKG
jgi:aminocarboxymuconate-semialdehyde decarboxylase